MSTVTSTVEDAKASALEKVQTVQQMGASTKAKLVSLENFFNKVIE